MGETYIVCNEGKGVRKKRFRMLLNYKKGDVFVSRTGVYRVVGADICHKVYMPNREDISRAWIWAEKWGSD